MKEISVQEMLSTVIRELRENGRWGTAHIYQTTLNVFSTFNDYQDLSFRKMKPALLKHFEVYLRQRNCSWNTVSTYIKTLRSTYNRAVDSGHAIYIPRLFEHVYTGTRADKKRALEVSDIGNLVRGADIDSSEKASPLSLEKTKTMFVLMFMCNKQILNRHFSVKLNHHLIIETISLYY